MWYANAALPRRALLGASLALGLGLSGVVMASRPDTTSKAETCAAVDPAVLAQLAPTPGAYDEPAGAAMDRAFTLMTAARRLCESGDSKSAQALYRRAERALTRYGSAGDDTSR